MSHDGFSSPPGFQCSAGTIGSAKRLATSSATCSITERLGASFRTVQSAYA